MIGDDLIGAAVLLAVLLAVLGVGEAWARLGNPQPEHSRKFVHLASAAACLLFPFLIESPLVVGAMAVGMSAFFAFAGHLGLLQALDAVERSSRGSEYYAVAIFMVFLLAGDDLWIYFSSVLVLGVADAFAALIGIRYGRLRYSVQDGEKSVEGSFAFFAIACAAVLVTAPFFAELPWRNLLHIAVAAGVLLTCFEAISLDGADNLFVPVAAAVILEKLAEDTLAVLIFQNLHLLVIFASMFAINSLVRRLARTPEAPFDGGGIIAFALFAFGSWALAGAPWALPVVVGFVVAICAWLASNRLTEVDLSMRIRPTYRALLLPFGVVLLANMFRHWDALYGPYLAVGAVVLAFAVTTLWRPNPEVRGPMYSTRFCAAVGLAAGLVMVGPAWLLYPEVGAVTPLVLIAVATAVSASNYWIIERRPRQADDEFYWPASQIALVFAVGAAVFLAQTNGFLQMWEIPVDRELMRHQWTPWWW